MKTCINHPDRPAVQSRNICAECHAERVKAYTKLRKRVYSNKRKHITIKPALSIPDYWDETNIISIYLCGSEQYSEPRVFKKQWSYGGLPCNTRSNHYF